MASMETKIEQSFTKDKPLELDFKKILEVIGSYAGVSGALIMSFMPEFAFFAWILWLLSSVALMAFSIKAELRYILRLQIDFTIINVSGVYNTIGSVI